jgi:hypothetical protein
LNVACFGSISGRTILPGVNTEVTTAHIFTAPYKFMLRVLFFYFILSPRDEHVDCKNHVRVSENSENENISKISPDGYVLKVLNSLDSEYENAIGEWILKKNQTIRNKVITDMAVDTTGTCGKGFACCFFILFYHHGTNMLIVKISRL